MYEYFYKRNVMSVRVDFVNWRMNLSCSSFFLEPYILSFDKLLAFLSIN